MKDTLQNFESSKLVIENPNILNLFLFLIVVFVTFISVKRCPNSFHILDKSQTNQLKGAAILMIIVGHLWVHVASVRADFVFSGEAVALFLILSGFGLTVSFLKKPQNFKTFLIKRVKRVMVPYWIGTVLFLLLDFLILGKTYSINEMLMTTLGLNLNQNINHIDYVRWFVTFILMWYFLFYSAMSMMSPLRVIIFLFINAIIMFPIHYYLLHFSWYQFLAFPIGCCCGLFYQDLQKLYSERKRMFGLLALLGTTWVILYKTFCSFELFNNYLWDNVPNIFLIALFEFNSIILCFALIVGLSYLGYKQYQSRFLGLCGKYSYELYLVHGAFLIKYNAFFRNDSLFFVLIGFVLLIVFLIFFAAGLSKLTRIFI